MKCIFDVDRTLFNTKKFSQDAEPYKADGTWVTPKIWDILDARDYVYDDVFSTLEKLGKNNVEILTAVTPELGPESVAFQKTKLERSGLMEFAAETTFMEGLKGEYAKSIANGEPAAFLDDRIEQLESVKDWAPNVLPVLMDRDKEHDSAGFEKFERQIEFKKASSLEEFLNLVSEWDQTTHLNEAT